MANDDHVVTTSVQSWLDICNAHDKDRERQIALGPIVYEFGGGRVLKREGPDPYASVGTETTPIGRNP
jgi:hypothetical protein